MHKVVIIDDEPLARLVIKQFLQAHSNFEVVGEANNGFEGIKIISEKLPDLIFLDIQMPKINGFEMLEVLDENPSVIFTTAFDEYALQAFDVAAVDYLLKPFSQERFSKSIEKWLQQKESYSIKQSLPTNGNQPNDPLRIVIKDGVNIKIIPTDEVIFIEAYDDYVKIKTNAKTFLKYKTMNYYEQTLDSNHFIRIHRSYIINIRFLTRIESFEKGSYRAIFTDDSSLPISRAAYPKMKAILGV